MSTATPRARILLCVNDLWNVANFRLRLVERLEAEGYRITLAGPPDPAMEARLGAPDRTIITFPMRRDGLSPLAEAALLARFVRLVASTKPDVVLSFTPKPNIYASLAARLASVPAIPNVSGLGTAFIKGGALQAVVARLYRTAFRAAPRVFFQNAEDLDLFVGERMVRAGQAVLLPGSGVDLERFAPAPRRSGKRHLRFLFVGRLLGDKGVREFAEAARMVRRSRPDVRFQLVGPVHAQNRTAIGRAELDGWVQEGIVEYLGVMDDVRPALAEADAVVLPSYREGLPRSLLEASAMGKPLIATDVPGNRSLVDEGLNGLLCEARSASSLAAALMRFVDLEPAARQVMGERARAKVVLGFSEEKVIGAYMKALNDVIHAGVC